VPYADGYPEGLDREEFGLIRLRTEVYQGMIFATFKEDIEPLVDPGPGAKWMDLFMKQGAGFGVKVLGEHNSASPATGRSSWRTPRTPIISHRSQDLPRQS
jgi:phenylpropionate dioxygenase-like ring-hydroxylating dioxygenase large terminal subunit